MVTLSGSGDKGTLKDYARISGIYSAQSVTWQIFFLITAAISLTPVVNHSVLRNLFWYLLCFHQEHSSKMARGCWEVYCHRHGGCLEFPQWLFCHRVPSASQLRGSAWRRRRHTSEALWTESYSVTKCLERSKAAIANAHDLQLDVFGGRGRWPEQPCASAELPVPWAPSPRPCGPAPPPLLRKPPSGPLLQRWITCRGFSTSWVYWAVLQENIAQTVPLQPKQSVIFNSSCHLIRYTARVTVKNLNNKKHQQQNPEYNVTSTPAQSLT